VAELRDIFHVHFLIKWELFDINNHLGKSRGQTCKSLHKWKLIREDVDFLA